LRSPDSCRITVQLAAALPDPGTHRDQAMTIYRDLDVPEARA
jgi:hypothetical protein